MPNKEKELSPEEEFDQAFEEEPTEEPDEFLTTEPQDDKDYDDSQTPENEDTDDAGGKEREAEAPPPEKDPPATEGTGKENKPAGDLWTGLSDSQRDELLKLQAERSDWEHRYRSDEGRFHAAQRLLQAERAKTDKAPSKEEVEKAFTSTEAFQKFKGDYPDIATMFELQAQHVAESTRGSVLNELQPVLARIEEQEQRYQQVAVATAKRTEAEKLSAVHPDWEDIGKSPDYWRWVAKQPPSEQLKARSSNDAQELASLLSFYKAERRVAELENTKHELAKTTQERNRRLEQSRSSIPRGSAPSLDGLPQDFDAVFDSITK